MTARRFIVPLLAACLVLAGCEQALTEENFARIQKDMSLSEVETILGVGERQDSGGTSISGGGVIGSSSNAGAAVQDYLWKEDGREVVITFREGKVISVRKSGF